MRILLDTNILLRSIRDPDRLSSADTLVISDKQNVVMFSVASIWEIGIKSALGRWDFDIDPAAVLAAARLDFHEHSITSADALRAAALPRHHQDPFDRMLVAQAIGADAVLLTADRLLVSYGRHVRLAE